MGNVSSACACGRYRHGKHRYSNNNNMHRRYSMDDAFSNNNTMDSEFKESLKSLRSAKSSDQSTSFSQKFTRRIKKKDSKKVIPRLLLLGPGESGKSTLSRQARLLHGAPFEPSEKKRFADSIRYNTVTSAQILVKEINRHRIRLHKLVPGFADDMATTAAARALIEAAQPPLQDQPLSEEVATAIAEFWAAPSVKLVFRRRDDFEFSIFDTAPHFWDRVLDIAVRDYEPTIEDIMACRIRTTGIIETKIRIADEENPGRQSEFSLIDVGGQRAERLKWVHLFDDESVMGVLYVVALSEFNQVLFEDNKTNRLVEALELWKGITKLKTLANSALILFLNKVDVFEAKLKHLESFEFVGSSKKGIRTAFPDYTGAPSDVLASLEFIQRKFEEVVYTQDEKSEYCINKRLSSANSDLTDIDLDNSERVESVDDNNSSLTNKKALLKSRSKSNSAILVKDSNKNMHLKENKLIRQPSGPPARREVYIHITCATDTSQMAVVFQSLRDSMIQHNLRLSGLL